MGNTTCSKRSYRTNEKKEEEGERGLKVEA
jgi:hypothetical protein